MTVKEEALVIEDMIDNLVDNNDIENFDMDMEMPNKDMIIFDPVDQKEIKKTSEIEYEKDTIEDYEYARKIYRHLIKQGTHTLVGILQVAKQDGSARAFEVSNDMIRTIASTTDQLMKLQKDVKEVNSVEKRGIQQADTINNVQFVGTALDMLNELEEDATE